MKKLAALTLVPLLSISLAACSGAPAGDAGQAAEKETYSLRLATHYETSHPGYAALERIADALNEKTDGQIEVTLYPASQLGDYTQTYQDLTKGAIDLALIPIPSEMDKKLEMNFVPFMVTSYDKMEQAFGQDSGFYKQYTEVHANLGVKLLGIYVEGFVGMGFKTLPENYADATAAKNMKVRAPAIQSNAWAAEDMGFSVMTIPYADAYTALQTGVVDGWIGGTPQLNYSGFRDVIKYFVSYNVFPENIGFFASQELFDSLPADLQATVEEVFMAEAINSYKTAEEADNKALEQLREYGIETLTLTDEEMQGYVENAQQLTWPRLAANIGQDTLDMLIEETK